MRARPSLPPPTVYARVKDWRLHIVTQGTSFLVFPALVFGIVSAVHRSDPDFEKFDRWALVGFVVMGCLPTTVSSNVVMTGQAGGSQEAATIEVILGNLVGASALPSTASARPTADRSLHLPSMRSGTFLSPALLQMFLSTSATWAFGSPNAGPGGTGEIYRQVIQQLGCTVFVPLFVGEVVQWLWPVFIKKWRLRLRLAKFASLCLLGVIWSTFCNAFYSGAFEELSTPTVRAALLEAASRSRLADLACLGPPPQILLVLFVNILLYVVFSAALFVVARVIPMPRWLRSAHLQHPPLLTTTAAGATAAAEAECVQSGWWEEKKLMDGHTTVALLFCGAAKGACFRPVPRPPARLR